VTTKKIAADIGGQKKAGQTHEHHWKQNCILPRAFFIRDLSLRVGSVQGVCPFVSSSYSSHGCNWRSVDSLELDYQRHVFTRKEEKVANNERTQFEEGNFMERALQRHIQAILNNGLDNKQCKLFIIN